MQPLPSNHLLKIISHSFPGLLAYLDKNQRYLFINHHYQEWYGLESTEVLGKTPEEILGKEIYSQRKDKILRVLGGEKLKYLHTIPHRKLGKRTVEQIYEPDINQSGEVVGFLAMAYDITEQVNLEKRAKENESRFRGLTEVMPQLVWLADADGKFIFINNNWPLIGDWDRFRLEQVIGNLLTNAIRYGKGNPIEIKLQREHNNAILMITDHGYGIAEKDLERIFGRFERAISSSEVSGMGLGLFISKEIVETQKGRIWAKSDLNKGSTFFIELPLKEGETHVSNYL